ncbi:uroporphyrinogen-III synthase [Halioxenophilus aromaticivorans]|uniref:Uroporphyrinogen-III synthase n=1 Tax=Halioxenophilus aromaticivorans TaxID=1306992 RepID=A0AAV3U531_9ALTE
MTRVWVSRPEAQARSTCAALVQLGLQPWSQPVMEIHPLAELAPANRTMVMDLDLYQVAIFISQNAVRHGVAAIEAFWPQVPLGVAFLAVGNATARALQQAGILAEAPQVAMDSEALLALPVLAEVEQQRIIIFKGVGGRTELADTLSARGARVDNCPLYERKACTEAATALAQSDFGLMPNDCTLAYSGESIQLIHTALQAAQRRELLARTTIVPGPRVAAIAQELGFSRVIQAQNATDPAMLAALAAVELRI